MSLVRFGVFEVDLAAGELRKSGVRIKIQEQPFQLLRALLERPGEVVTRDELRERLWPEDTFVDFDRSLNTAASRLREALGDSAGNPRSVETLPRRGYRFVAPVNAEAGSSRHEKATLSPGASNLRPKRAVLLVAGIVALVVLAVSGWIWLGRRESADPQQPITAVPLTSYSNWERTPTLSPDGSQVAFAWDGERLPGNVDIYVKVVGGGTPLRLTTNPANDFSPAWSPDGESIAFLRDLGNTNELLLIPALGGTERRVAELPRLAVYPYYRYIGWSPDGEYLVYPNREAPEESLSLFALSRATGEQHRLTSGPEGKLGDGDPAFSADGGMLAFVRHTAWGLGQLCLLPVSRDLVPSSEPHRLDSGHRVVYSPTWTPDGREIVFSAGPMGNHGLWRVAASGSGGPKPLGLPGDKTMTPEISRDGRRLVYVSATFDYDLWRIDLPQQGENPSPIQVTSTSRLDYMPDYSPDGQRIVFCSDRTGSFEIWGCDADGSNEEQLTALEVHSMAPRWFPDGRRIMFTSNKEGARHLYVVDAVGGMPRRFTTGTADENTPSLSRDNEWVYFSSRRTGRWEIWRMQSRGGEMVQITRGGGYCPLPSVNGEMVYYLKEESIYSSEL